MTTFDMTASGRRGRRCLSDDERVLWKEVTRSIVPLKSEPAALPDTLSPAVTQVQPPAPPASATSKSARAGKPSRVPTPPPSSAAARTPPLMPLAPLGRRLKQSLGRGAESIDGRLDLHGLTQAQAHVALERFLTQAQARGAKTVLVITGKGRRDEPGERGVLARQVPQWLRLAEMRTCVIGFETAHRSHGGDGALYIRVRREKPTR